MLGLWFLGLQFWAWPLLLLLLLLLLLFFLVLLLLLHLHSCYSKEDVLLFQGGRETCAVRALKSPALNREP